MQTSIKQINDGFNRIDEIEFGMGIDRNDHIQNMSQLGIRRNGFIFTEVYKDLMYPIANTL